jgi:hypothetical protein
MYIKLVTEWLMLGLISKIQEQVDYKHTTGEVLKVTIMSAGLGPRTIRVANLSPNYQMTTC